MLVSFSVKVQLLGSGPLGKEQEAPKMSCPSCQSQTRRQFNSEIALHFENLSKPHVFAFPMLLVCMDCGFTEFRLQEKDLRELVVGESLPQSHRVS
jgi:hypothetical protein